MKYIFDVFSPCIAKSCLAGVFVTILKVQHFFANVEESYFKLEVHRPHVMLIQETWLDPSAKEMALNGYEIV